MSTGTKSPDHDSPEPGSEEWVAANEEKIRELAESDAADAWVYQRLLQSLEEDESEEGSA